MKIKIKKIVIFVCMLIVSTILFMYYVYSEKKEKQNNNCACVFDLDDTITCGFDQAKKAIDDCKSRSCVFSINTARTQKYHDDIKYEKLGLTKESFIDMFDKDFYYGTWNKKGTYLDHNDLLEDVALNKVEHLNTVQKKYAIPKNRIILFDDNLTNVKKAKENGFSIIHANNNTCGLNKNIIREISDILD